MKRRAPCDVQEAVNDTEEQQDLGKVSTPDEIAKRKILKIKGPKSAQPESEQTEVKFKLQDNLQKVPNKEDENKTYSFLDKKQEDGKVSSLFDNSNVKKNQEIQDGKAVEISDAEKMKVAENLQKIGTGEQKIQSSGLFNNSINKTEAAKPTGGLFSNNNESKPSSGGLFSNIPKSNTGSTGLFGNTTSGGLFSNNNTENKGGLFSNNNNTTSGGLFSKPAEGAQTGGLFSGNAGASSGGLFSNNSAGSGTGGLFQNLNSGAGQQSTLFANKPAEAAAENDEDEDDGGDVSGQNTPEIDKDKTVKFEYQDIMERLVEKQIVKFKKNTGETQDKGTITIEKLKGKENAQAIVVFRNHLKQIMYQGNLIKKLSTFKNLNNKPQNIMVQTIVETKDAEGKSKFDRDTLKIQFENGDDGNDFKANLEKELN